MEKVSEFGALVLCGGKSQRIGTNKAYLLKDNQTFINIILDKLLKIFNEVIIAVDESQKYTQIIDNRVLVVEDSKSYSGPLEGLFQGLKKTKKDYLFVCGCDMPNIREDCIKELALYVDGINECVLPFFGKPQILHGFYRRDLYVKIGEGDYSSIKALLNSAKVKYISKFDCNIKESIININTTRDYENLIGGING